MQIVPLDDGIIILPDSGDAAAPAGQRDYHGPALVLLLLALGAIAIWLH